MPRRDIRQIALCELKGIRIPKDAYILDFGCGKGGRVYELIDAGYAHSAGYEVMDRVVLRNATDRDRFYVDPDGHIPVPDGTFDFVFSDQVLEHVVDQRAALTEIVRVLKPGGVSVHVFPSKWQLIEPHMKVPLGGLRPFKRFSWYLLWGALGIRNEYQHGLSAKVVATRNYKFAQTKINYLSCREYQRLFSLLPISWSWEELGYIQASYKPRILRLARVAERVPLVITLARTFAHRVLMFRKAPIVGDPA